MASVFKKYDRQPIPEGAEITTQRKKKVVRFKDDRDRTVIHPLSEDGACMLVERRCWYIAYVDATGHRRVEKGFGDREASEKKARDLEREAARIKVGLPTADKAKMHAPIEEALDLYLKDLERRGRNKEYCYTARKLIERLLRECKWTTMPTIRSDKLTAWLASMKEEGLSPRSLNYYLATMNRFLDWCAKEDYVEGNVLARIGKADQKGERRRVRRALSLDELGRLLAVSGRRRLLYLTAVLTGLRRKELRHLLWSDLFLDEARPYVWLRSKTTKNKRSAILPLAPELIDALRQARPTHLAPDTRVFRTMVQLRTFQRDLRKAGISYRDERGRQCDFHSLRMTFNSLLARQDVPLRVARELMRHSSIVLTAGAYNDPAIYDLDAAVHALPPVSKKETEAGKAG
jgi:integrase